MTGITDLLDNKHLSLFVSLPSNSAEVVQAAVDGGADAIKVHINVEHRASGQSFGSLREYEDLFSRIIQDSKIPFGVVPGDNIAKIKEVEIDALIEMGAAFISVYHCCAPAWLISKPRISKMIAIPSEFKPGEVESASSLPIEILEASIIPGEEYGQPLSVYDLLRYRQLVQSTTKPVVVPSQKKIKSRDISSLIETGVKGLMIGAIVTGSEPLTIYEETKHFRQTIDQLS